MSKRTTQRDLIISKQQELFDNLPAEGSLDLLLGLKQGMSREMHRCGIDRYLLAAQISRLTTRDLSKDMLDKYVSSDASYRPPADIITPFCLLTGSFSVVDYLLEPLNAAVLRPEDKDLVELARLQEQRKAIDERIMAISRQRNLGGRS